MKPDVLDDHYYKRADEFFEDVKHYDVIDRNGPKIFVGEWATREGSPTTNMGAALGDAAWMTGMERNSDLIVMASYAPLFVNVNPGGMQWESDLIGYDAMTSYGVTELLRAMYVCGVSRHRGANLFGYGWRRSVLLLGNEGSGERCRLPEAGECFFTPTACEHRYRGAGSVARTGTLVSLTGRTMPKPIRSPPQRD